MAKPLRYEAAGGVYHVMARGDGGKTMFDDDHHLAIDKLSALGTSRKALDTIHRGAGGAYGWASRAEVIAGRGWVSRDFGSHIQR
jgi:predicted metal-dependent HD superfamily phosphohydrolase